MKIAIMGYGNLGKGIECAVRQNEDMELVAVFTRRNPATEKVASGVPVYSVDKLPEMTEDEQLKLLATDGMLVKRPLVVGEDLVLVGFKEAEWVEKLK